MITANDIRGLRAASRDYQKTHTLKTNLALALRNRSPWYLTLGEFDEILHWKLRGQYDRQRKQRSANTEETVRAVTGLALSIQHANKEYELELRFRILCALRGVEVPVASAVLALVFPDKYAVVDFRGWRQVFGKKRNSFTVPDYKKYLDKVQLLAKELGWPVQEADLAIWEYDLTHS
jgi:hypothetical protein